MTSRFLRSLLTAAISLVGLTVRSLGADTPLTPTVWQATVWHGEDARVSVSSGWKAVVSLPRARLVHFGPADRDVNLLFAPTTPDDPAGRGGHRVWLGPQTEWASIWPPPAAWEAHPAVKVTSDDARLVLTLAPTGDGWPDLVRTYAWQGAELVCGTELHGGSRAAQLISIFQVPRDALVSVDAAPPAPAFPHGYVRLPAGGRGFSADFMPPPQVARAGAHLTLRNVGLVEKLGFRPQTLVARRAGYTLRVARGAERGTRVGELDAGFHTQVYLGNAKDTFIELEQLTSTWSPAAPAAAATILSATAP